jgi:exportin-7
MLDSVDIVVAGNGSVEDPLEDEGSLKEQMDRLPVIARLQYDTVAQYLLSQFEQYLSLYDQVQQPNAGNSLSPQVRQQMCVLEGRMTWLTYMVAAVIGVQTAPDPRKGQGDLLWDGRLSRCVFQLSQIVDFRYLNDIDSESLCIMVALDQPEEPCVLCTNYFFSLFLFVSLPLFFHRTNP